MMGEPYELFAHPIIREKGGNNRKRRSLVAHGNPANFYQAPWSVFIEKDHIQWCTGTWISPRHIITAAHCFFYRAQWSRCRSREDLQNLTTRILLECSEDDPFVGKCQDLKAYEHPQKIVKLFVPKAYFECDKELADIIIAELEDNNDPYLSQFACIPEKELSSQKEALFYGYGNQPMGAKSKKMLNGLNLTMQIPELDRIISYATNNTSCSGDSGTGYVIRENNKNFVAAIHHGGHPRNSSSMSCGDLNVEKVHLATSVHYHLDWICLYSGICPKVGMFEEVLLRAGEIQKKVDVFTL